MNSVAVKRRIAVVGGSGQGKSYFIKNHLLPSFAKQSKNIYIWDKNGEYNPEQSYKLNINKWQKFERNRDALIRNICDLQNSLILIDEAATVFNKRSFSQDFEEKMIGARHDNVIILVVYHSLSAIPEYMVQYLDRIVLFKTHETATKFKNKFDRLEINEAFDELQKNVENKQGIYKIIDL